MAGCARSPSPPPLPQGARGPASEVGGAIRSGGGAARRSVWGRGGAAPTSRKSEGGWVGQSGAARSSGMGVWGAQPPAGDARAAPAPPHPHPLPQGARGPDGPRGLGARSGGLRPLPLTPTLSRKGRGGRTALGRWGRDPIRRRRSPALRVGAWGRSPHMKESPRAGGWARAAQRAHPGWGCGGRSPPQATGGLRPLPLTPTLSRKGRGGRTGLGGWGAIRSGGGAARRSGWGRGGAAPT